MPSPGKISVVVRTLNSERTLAKTLRSVRMQDQAVSEIIIVDSGSKDRTAEIAKKFACKWVQYPAGKSFNYSLALNIGVAAAMGDLILIISSHTVFLYKDTLRAMADHLEKFHACGASCDFLWPPFEPTKRNDPLRNKLIEVVYQDTFDGLNGLSNSCSLIERACWTKHAFDETMPTAEDHAWSLWCYENLHRPTVKIRNAGVAYLRPFSLSKQVKEYAVIANRINPSLRRWRAIFGLYLSSAATFRRDAEGAKKYFYTANELLFGRLLRRSYFVQVP